ncbi:MAG: TM0106 family RecB-like putative nuclease [Microthrixaceae bacterium]
MPVPGIDALTACPVRLQLDLVRPGEPAAPTEAARRRAELAAASRQELLRELVDACPEALVIAPDGDDPAASTRAAMRDRVPMVVRPVLYGPTPGATATGPDVLLVAPDGGYHPLEVVGRTTTSTAAARPMGDDAASARRFATVDTPWWHAAGGRQDRVVRRRRNDVLRLAHHRRALAAAGHAAAGNVGATLGTDRLVTWHDLAEPSWRPPAHSASAGPHSAMELHEAELDLRRRVAAVAARHATDPSVPLLLEPVRTHECGTCRWRSHCTDRWETSGDVSLLPGSSWSRSLTLQAAGVRTIDQLARLDPERPPAALTAGAPALDGEPLPPRAQLVEWVDLARARLADAPVLRRRGVERIDVHRADVEVDIDLENTDRGVYLWGALVTDRTGTGLATEGYRSFVSWAEDPAATEVALFEEFADWLARLLDHVEACGRTVGVYCFHEQAEAGAMRRLAAAPDAVPGRAEWVEQLVGSPQWVDLYRVARDHLITGTSMGLKFLAGATGFRWDDPDPGGEQSMDWHRAAVGDPSAQVRAAQRDRLLAYNRNDTEATLALREAWRHPERLPRVDRLGT